LICPLLRADKVTRVEGRDPIHLLRFPSDVIVALILGARIGEDQVTRVREAMKAERWRHVRLYRASLSEERFALQFEAVEAAA
jgi:hypothetical protein